MAKIANSDATSRKLKAVVSPASSVVKRSRSPDTIVPR